MKQLFTFSSWASSMLWSKRLRMTTWKREKRDVCVRTTMDGERRETDTRVTLWYTHNRAHTHTHRVKKKKCDLCWTQRAGETKQKKSVATEQWGSREKLKIKALSTSCCSALPWSKLKDTSCSSSGSEPCSSSAWKTQREQHVTPVRTLEWGRCVHKALAG